MSNNASSRYIGIIGAAKYLFNKYLKIDELITPDVQGNTLNKLIKITTDCLDYSWVRNSPPGSCTTEESQYRAMMSWYNQTVHQITERHSWAVFDTFPLMGPEDRFLPSLEQMLKFLAKELDEVPTWTRFGELTAETEKEVLEKCLHTNAKILETPIFVMHCSVNGVPTIAGCILESVNELSRSVHVFYSDKVFMGHVTEHHVTKKLEEIRKQHLSKEVHAPVTK